MDGQTICKVAQEAIDLHTNPQSHHKFTGSLPASIKQVVDEQDTLDLVTIGEVMHYRRSLINAVTGSIDERDMTVITTIIDE